MNNLIKSMDRRRFLRVLGGASALAGMPAPLRAAGGDLVTVSVLHTTDLHGHIAPAATYEGVTDVGGLARCATQIRLWKQMNPHAILIDAGDVYQGTQLGLLTQGQAMIRGFNHMAYDAWIIGNHEFDWGVEAVHGALNASAMPVLCANSVLDGKPAGQLDEAGNPLARIQPYIIKELAGFKIGVVGVTTPGMPYWFHDDLLRGFVFTDPVEPVRQALRELRALGADAVVLAGHMGLRRGGDDFANRTVTLLEEFPEAVAFIGGHTHQDVPHQIVHRTPFTQASYFGIHAGRLDLTFDRESRRLLWVQPMTSWMDDRFAIDPAVLALSAAEREEADAILATPVGTLAETLHIETDIGQPSQVEELIAASFMETMEQRGVPLDGVIHGLIFPDGDFEAGDKTVEDLWRIIPYENMIVTTRLNREEIIEILYEVYTNWSKRNLMGMRVELTGRAGNLVIHEVFTRDGRPLEANRRYTVAFNSFDAQSAGQRYMRLREILRQPASEMKLHPVGSREALIDYFTARETVQPVSGISG